MPFWGGHRATAPRHAAFRTRTVGLLERPRGHAPSRKRHGGRSLLVRPYRWFPTPRTPVGPLVSCTAALFGGGGKKILIKDIKQCQFSKLLPPFSFLRRTNELCRDQGKNQLHAICIKFLHCLHRRRLAWLYAVGARVSCSFPIGLLIA
jgi:hypothetical protein